MEKEDRIIEMLEKQSKTLEKHSETLEKHGQMLERQSKTLERHGQTLQEHGQILNALRSGQENLKAEFDGLKTSTKEGFAEIKQEQANINAGFEVLQKDTWTTKVDMQRVKNTMGMG